MRLNVGKFPLGDLVATAGVSEFVNEDPARHEEMLGLVARHLNCDWGDVCDEDKKLNDEALTEGSRLLSSYLLAGKKVWIITEADRSVTTVLFPDEY